MYNGKKSIVGPLNKRLYEDIKDLVDTTEDKDELKNFDLNKLPRTKKFLKCKYFFPELLFAIGSAISSNLHGLCYLMMIIAMI